MEHGRLDSILGSYSIPEIDFSSHDPFKDTYAVWTVHCLKREKFENGEKTTRILYAYQRGKTALHVLENYFDGPQQVHTENFRSRNKTRFCSHMYTVLKK